MGSELDEQDNLGTGDMFTAGVVGLGSFAPRCAFVVDDTTPCPPEEGVEKGGAGGESQTKGSGRLVVGDEGVDPMT